MSEKCGSRSELVFGAATMVPVTEQPGGVCFGCAYFLHMENLYGVGFGVFLNSLQYLQKHSSHKTHLF